MGGLHQSDQLRCRPRNIFRAYGGDVTYQALTISGTRSQFLNGTRPALHNLLLQNRSFLASDARDKVFGLLSLANNNDVRLLGIEPDYHLSAEQVYKNLAVSLLHSRRDLDLFDAPRVLQNSKISSLPSWVPDWSTSDPCVPLCFRGPSGYGEPNRPEPLLGFNASRKSRWSPSFSDGKSLLGLSGLKIDQIETTGRLSQTRYSARVSHMYQLFRQSCDVIELLSDWEFVASARSRFPYITGEKQLDAYWQTLCAGHLPDGFSTAKKDFRYKYYLLLRYVRPFVRFAVRFFPRSEKNTFLNRIFYSLFRGAWQGLGLTPSKIQQIGFPPSSVLSNYRRMIRTRKGYIALAPRYAQPGDWIGVFAGGKVPLVIRQDGSHWQLIGECYVHGLMKGEVWDEGKCEKLWIK